MIAILSGKIAEKLAETVVIDVQGVGYGLLMSLEDYSRLSTGDEAKVYIHEHIRENSYDLYGFIKQDTKKLFEQLLEVNGVGPKMALNMLSIGSVGQVQAAIASGDVKFLQSAGGVGKRVAERVVVDLKDKVGLPSEAADALLSRPGVNPQDEATQALASLGYSNEDAAQALAKVDKTLPTEERVKQALKGGSL